MRNELLSLRITHHALRITRLLIIDCYEINYNERYKIMIEHISDLEIFSENENPLGLPAKRKFCSF